MPSKDGFRVKAHYFYTQRGVDVEASRAAELGPDYELRSDSLDLTLAGRNHQSVSITAEPRAGKLSFRGTAGGDQASTDFALHPGTVVLNNFDPSGVQELIYLDVTNPRPDHKYWALLAQGKGIQIPIEFTSAQPAEGMLNGSEIPSLKHWHLQIAAVEAEIWADAGNNLMEFAVPAQTVAYRRTGFSLKKAQQATASTPVPGAEAVEEKSVSFTSDGLKMPGILALPKGRKDTVPIVVLVHGSGPHDADETIGPNKPFRDLAYGLAADGIATLRYDKRTHFAPETFNAHPDLDHEVTLDAVAALTFASSQPEVDPKRVFILGHSLGGTMAPVIAADRLQQAPGSVRGIIFLAGAALGIEDTIMRQLLAAATRQGADQSQLDAVQKQWQAIFQTVNDPATPADQMVGAPPVRLPEGYWRSWIAQNPASELAKLDLPALVLRGTKDIQVSEGDYQALAKANTATGSENKEIDGLNHLMMPVTGDATGQEYLQPGHVSPEVIRLIADWIGTFH